MKNKEFIYLFMCNITLMNNVWLKKKREKYILIKMRIKWSLSITRLDEEMQITFKFIGRSQPHKMSNPIERNQTHNLNAVGLKQIEQSKRKKYNRISETTIESIIRPSFNSHSLTTKIKNTIVIDHIKSLYLILYLLCGSRNNYIFYSHF